MSQIKLEIDANDSLQVDAAFSFFAVLSGRIEGLTIKEEPAKSVVEPKKEEKPAPKKTTGKKKQSAPAKEEAPAEEEEKPTEEVEKEEPAKTEEKPSSGQPSISINDVRMALGQKITNKDGSKNEENRKWAKAKLTELGCENVTALPEESYADFLEFLKGLKVD